MTWKNERQRHSMAKKGIRTKTKKLVAKGVGNFIPNTLRENDFIYIEYPENMEDYEYDIEYENLIENIIEILPKSFYIDNRPLNKYDTLQSYNHNFGGVLLASNDLYEVGLYDNTWSIALVIATKENAPAFADANLSKVSKKIFDKLNENGLSLHIRNGPWMSSPYTKR